MNCQKKLGVLKQKSNGQIKPTGKSLATLRRGPADLCYHGARSACLLLYWNRLRLKKTKHCYIQSLSKHQIGEVIRVFFLCVALTGPRPVVIYIPGPIDSLFAIAPTHILGWKFCHPFMHLGITDMFSIEHFALVQLGSLISFPGMHCMTFS